jgi:hypothetical protein
MKDLQTPLPERPAITLRVSRDSGRTYGPQVEVWVTAETPLPDEPMLWPPCQCPQHHDIQEV